MYRYLLQNVDFYHANRLQKQYVIAKLKKFCQRLGSQKNLILNYVNLSWILHFLRHLKNGLIPKLLNFKVANSTLPNPNSYKACQLKLLQ